MTVNYGSSYPIVDSELAAIAALADGVANPTVTSLGSYNQVFNGTKWDRMRGNSTGGVFFQGPTAHDSAITGNPLPGVRAADPTSLPTSVAAGDASYLGVSLQQEVLVYLTRLLAGEFLSEGTGGVMAIARQALSTSTFSASRDSSTALEASKIVKATTGNLYRTFGVIDKSAPTGMYYVLHLDSATLTADGAVTHLITPMPVNHTNGTDSTFDTDHFEYGVNAANGIVRVLSSTMVTKTITAAYMFATSIFK